MNDRSYIVFECIREVQSALSECAQAGLIGDSLPVIVSFEIDSHEIGRVSFSVPVFIETNT
jgi:hypothetical protein